jgi:hypothetical protein
MDNVFIERLWRSLKYEDDPSMVVRPCRSLLASLLRRESVETAAAEV